VGKSRKRKVLLVCPYTKSLGIVTKGDQDQVENKNWIKRFDLCVSVCDDQVFVVGVCVGRAANVYLESRKQSGQTINGSEECTEIESEREREREKERG
jgi:hypothetical protein